MKGKNTDVERFKAYKKFLHNSPYRSWEINTGRQNTGIDADSVFQRNGRTAA